MRPFLRLGNATHLPYPDRSFDLVTAINTIHNLPLAECKQALREIQRVSQGRAFIVVDAWRTLTSLAVKTSKLDDQAALVHARDLIEREIAVLGERGQQALRRLGA